MGYSQIEHAVVFRGMLSIGGPIEAREGLEDLTWSLRFVLVQDDEVVAGDGVWWVDRWKGSAEAGKLTVGEPAQALAVVTRVYRNPTNASPLVTETINWSETITLTSEFPPGVDEG